MNQREYWTQQMDAAFSFMEKMAVYPIEESGEKMVSMEEGTNGLDVSYAEGLLDGKHLRLWFLRERLIKSFAATMRMFNDHGWRPKIIAAFRTPEIQTYLTQRPHNVDLIIRKCFWELKGEVPTGAFVLKRLSALIATRLRCSGHLAGAAVDCAFFDRTTGEAIDCGGEIPEISERSSMHSPFITEKQRDNRRISERIFLSQGFVPYEHEFWHFSKGDSYEQYYKNSGQPSRYGPILFQDGAITPMDSIESVKMLNTPEYFEERIAEIASSINMVNLD